MTPQKSSAIRRTVNRLVPAKVRRSIKQVLYGLPPICPQLRAWAETTGKAEIVKIYWDTHEGSRALPPSDGEALPPIFTENQTYPIYDRTLYRIPQVKIRGRAGILTLPDGSVCHQTTWIVDQVTGSPDYNTKWRGPVVSKPGNYCTLIFYWGLNYYHWYNDVLSSLFENLELFPADTRFIIPADASPHHLATLDLLGIGPDRRLPFDGSEVWKLENLWFQPPSVHPDNQTPGAMHWISRTLNAAVPVESSEKSLRLYISRRLAPTRRVANEEDLLRILDRYNFTAVMTEELPLLEQIRLFRNAEIIVAPHGAGLANMIFSSPGTPILELFAADTIRRCYWALACELGHPYRFLVGDPVFGRGHEADIQVDLNRFQSRLESILRSDVIDQQP